jgi:hypothetical protein
MDIENPILVLTFLGGDLEAGHSTGQTVINEAIIRGSISFEYQLLNGLKSSSNQASLQISRGCPSIEDIIATDGDIKAVLKDGQSVLFTGYVSTSFSWSVTTTGEQALSITLEDVGTRLFGKSFIKSGHHLFNCTASTAISAVCTAAGVTVSSQCLTLSDTVTKTVDSSVTCHDILDQMLYELGYVYYFDSLGELRLFKIDCQSTDNIQTLDGYELCSSGGKAITLSKKIRQYKSARVSFKTLGTASDYLVYRNTSGKDSSHPYCNMELGAGEYFDGTEVYSSADWETLEGDTTRENALIEACNAASETDLVGSNAIIAISNVEQIFTSLGSSMECSITASGGPYLSMLAHNRGNLTYCITRMDAYADILYEKETGVVRTSSSALDAESSDSQISEELSYVHTQALAQSHANLLGQYHRYCNSEYSFCSREDIPLGRVVHLYDSIFSGLEVNVMVISKSVSDSGSINHYSAIGISVFNLNAQTTLQTLTAGKNDTRGQQGQSFTLQISSSNGSAFRIGQVSTTLSCQVFLNLEEVTGQIDAWRFQWKRETGDFSSDADWNASEKAIGHKSVEIDSTDCPGRTVFNCEVDFDGLDV